MRRRLLMMTAAIAAVALVVAACDDNGNDVADDVTDTIEDIGDDVEDRVDDVVDEVTNGDETVTIENLAFSPDDITVDAGTTVTFDNTDSLPHTVTSGTPGDPTDEFSEDIDAGESAEITFDETGTYDYFCEIHNDMTGTVTVE